MPNVNYSNKQELLADEVTDTKTKENYTKEELNSINWSNKTLLIAEDEDTNFLYLQTALMKTRINIIRAVNGVQAVEIARTTPNLDLILMDIKMPEMNGIEATQAIKSFRKDVKIVAQTAFAMEEDKRNCEAVGCDGFLAKPIKLDVLISTIARNL
jgi:CheY-like chemotaxis protein